MTFDTQLLKNFPQEAGVYLMKDAAGKVLYVGKANNLQERLKQYFGKGDTRILIPYLLEKIATIDTLVVSSEKEALLVENTLIKKYRPRYNAVLKDDKTYFSLAINHRHLWPMIRVVRYKGRPEGNHLYFGPYTNARAARSTLKLLQRLFPLRQCSDRELVNRVRPCILYDLKLCVAPCVSKCTKEHYDTLVCSVIDFLRGHDEKLLKHLHQEMKEAAATLEFEKAAHIQQTIHDIEATLEKQKVDKAGLADIDVIGIKREGGRVALARLFFREGKLMGSSDHHFEENLQEDDDLIASFILQHYEGQSFLPSKIFLPFDLKKQSTLQEYLKIPLVTARRGEKRALVEMACKNAAAKLHKEGEGKKEKESLLIALEEKLSLTNYPERIECFDNSNLSGEQPVSALVTFVEGKSEKKDYRTYKLSPAVGSDDLAALQEALLRRYRNAQERDLPDLLFIDGGLIHLRCALQTLSELDISTVDVISLAKESGKHTKGLTQERIFLPSGDAPLSLPPHSPLLLFLQQIRDEAHRFALSFQKKQRKKKSLSSLLDTLPQIGPIKKKRLLTHFGSVKRIVEATEEELLAIPGITRKDVFRLKGAKRNLA